jgi:Flp pilus assembly protein TadD
MHRIIRAAVIALLAAGVLQAQNDSQAEAGSNFQGQIRYENNKPASFVRVQLWTEGETTWRSDSTTDRMGKFHTGAPCMIIQYRVEAAGFRPVQGQVDMSINPCRALADITLRALPGTMIPGSEPAPSGTVDARIAGITPDARAEFEAGRMAINSNQFAAAIPHLQNATALYPRYAEAYQLLGLSQLQTQQGPQAEASLKKAIAIEDKMPRAQYMLGMLLAMTGRVNLAEKPFTRFAERDPTNPDAHFELAKTEFALNKFPDTEMHARKAIELKEKNPGVQVVLAYSLLRQKKSAEAKAAFQQYLKLDPDSPMKADVEKTIAMIDEHQKGGQPAK